MRKLITSLWMLIIVVGFTNSTFPQTPSATLTSDSALWEYRLDRAVLTIDLSNEMFLDYDSLKTSDFILINYPTGLTIEKVQGNSPTQVVIDLAHDGTDNDIFINDFRVGIDHSVLKITDTLVLYTNPLWISGYIEQPVATLTADSILSEQRLDSRTLTINLTEERFIDYTTLSTAFFNLLNAPTGLTIESVQGLSTTQAKVNLAFDGTDFDTDFTKFRIEILSSVLFQTVTGYLATNSLIILSSVEPEAFMTDDSMLYEPRLGREYLAIVLKDELFNDYTSILVSDFVLINAPSGLSIESIQGVSPTRARIDLAFDGTDFDTNYTDFKVGINHSVLKVTETGVLYTNSLVIRAYVENPVAVLSSDSIMFESRLGYRILTIDLTEEKFLDYTSLLVSDFILVNAPVGLSIESLYGISPTRVKINLAFDGTDFDVAYTNFKVGIHHSVLIQTSSGVLYTNNLTIFGRPEVPQAILSADSILTEYRLDARTLLISLMEEEFLDYTKLSVTDFALVKAPQGLSIESITASDSVNVDLNLQFTGEDFDSDINDFSIIINRNVLIQSASDLLTNPLTIIADVKVFYDTVAIIVYDTIFETVTDTNTVTLYDTNYNTVIDTNQVYIYDTITETVYDTVKVTVSDTLNVIRFTSVDCKVTLTNSAQSIALEVLYYGDYLTTDVMFDECSVYDLTGSLIKIISLDTKIPISDLESGIYLFRFIVGSAEIVQQFYIE